MQISQHHWYPIASSDDLPMRHTFHGQLLGREFAVWRADDGNVNVWENRCLHRGVRLSIGINDGAELICKYHGWRYANRTAGCTYIPAHPADSPARTICNQTYPSIERYGLVWSGEAPDGELPVIAQLESEPTLTLRPIPVNATPALTLERLASYQFQPVDRISGHGATVTVVSTSAGAVTLQSIEDNADSILVLFVQPVDSNRCVIRGVLDQVDRNKTNDQKTLSVLRHHNERLTALRETIESEAASLPAPEPMQVVIKPAGEATTVDTEPVPLSIGRSAGLRVQVSRRQNVARDICAFELTSIGTALPAFQPGAHIDVHLPNGLIRQYSLTNGPGETAHYTIGVKLEPDSDGGSAFLHNTLRTGDVLAISEPRNNFPLRRDAVKTLLIAGGIGITPLLSMAQTLAHSALPFELHYFCQASDHVAFESVLSNLGSSNRLHIGLSPAQTTEQLRTLLKDYQAATHVYICGPAPMLAASRNIAKNSGWPDTAVHFEYFKNTTERDDTASFEIDLARSAMTLQVPAGKSILSVLRENGIDLPSSCEQGACGTCITTVLDGEPDHQDVYLNDTEKGSGKRIMTCVSRARSRRLVLDI